MDKGYELLYAGLGQLELQVPADQTEADIVQSLDQDLGQQFGIHTVEIDPSSGNVVITYNQRCWTNKSIIQTIGRQFNIEGKTEAVAPVQVLTFVCEEIIHAIKGRVRLLVPAVKGQANHTNALALKKFLKGQAGISDVRINRHCGSVIVSYDPAKWTSQTVILKIESYVPSEQQLQKFEDEVNREDHQLLFDLQLSGAALALSLVLEPPFLLPVVGLLLLRAGRTVFARAYDSLFRQHRLTIDSLDATAISLLMLQGSLTTAGVLMTLLTVADYIRANTQEKSRRAVMEVFDFISHYAWVVRYEEKILVPVEEVQVGDVVVVYPGERIPVDGMVISGKASVDQHALTGESMPVEKSEGQPVYAATTVREGKIYFQVTQVGNDTQVARIVQMIREAPIRDTRIQDYAERFANRIVPFSYLAAGVALLMGNPNQAVTLLVIDYGAGLRVAAPTTVLSAMAKGARQGILIRGGRHLEQLAEVDAIIFDKTGTLTVGRPEVTQIIPLRQDVTTAEWLSLAAAAEQRLSHPVAQAVVEAAQKQALFIPERSDSQYEIGLGVKALVNGQSVLVGSQRYLESRRVHFSQEAQLRLQGIELHAASPLGVAVEGELVGLLGIADSIRPESKAVVEALRQRGVKKIMMLTGDREAVAKEVAETLGISDYVAEVFPEAKLEAVKRLQAEGYTVAVVGDGINDSPALVQADVGIAVNGGTAVAQESAGVVLLKGDLWKLVEAVDIAQKGIGIIGQNWQIIIWANTVGFVFGFMGRIGPPTATLISDGAAIAAGANAIRPLLQKGPSQPPKAVRSPNGKTPRLNSPAQPKQLNGATKPVENDAAVAQNGRASPNLSKMGLTLRSLLRGLQEPLP